ncbi:hypothetical protein [Planomonospora algeriensis]
MIAQDVHAALNGQASSMLRNLVPLEFRRQAGAYFTGGKARDRFGDILKSQSIPNSRTVFWDPTCGAGDLLLAASEHLPLRGTFGKTLQVWANRLYGHDTQAEFVAAARLRLFLAAAALHRQRGDKIALSAETATRLFKHVQVGNGLEALRVSGGFRGHLLLNPPFGFVPAEQDCRWASGLTSQAGIFLLEAAQTLSAGGRLTAILPDVLRSGSRFHAWRKQVEKLITAELISPFGQFDDHTDIDVFLLHGRRNTATVDVISQAPWWSDLTAETRLGELFDIRVGPVVDNRDPHEGPEVPYLTARGMPPSGTMFEPSRRRHFPGKLLSPPFVAVRRTSRPGEAAGSRATGVLVAGSSPIAVDNHVITLKIKPGTDVSYPRLLDILSSLEVSDWLDHRIRCRHLTVGVLKSLPWRSP